MKRNSQGAKIHSIILPNLWKSIIVFILGCAILFMDCSKPEHSNPLDPLYEGETTIIQQDIFNLSTLADITVTDTTGGSFTISYTGDKPAIDVGSILVSEDGGGYLRKVTSVQEPDAATLTCQTQQAAITDAVIQGNADTTFALIMDEPASKLKGRG